MGDKLMLQKIQASQKIEVIPESQTTMITGNKFVTSLEYEQKKEKKKIDVQGIFIEIGLTPSSDFISLVKKDKWNQIIVDKKNKTSVEGIYAAGDVTDITEKQIIVAAGEGAKASLEIINYLNKNKTFINPY